MLRTQKEFAPPPEAPIFEATWEEFCEPLAFIDKIRAVGEKYGVCKIRPPPSWQPPFAVDVENFRFTPRIQKLNELEALSRVKLNFIDQLMKFWRLQGIVLKLPMLDGKFVDLYTLQKIVTREGGFIEATKKEAWCRVAQMMGYSSGRGCELFLCHNYEKIVHPYDLFLSGASLNAKKMKGGLSMNSKGGVKADQESLMMPTMKPGKLKKMRRMASNQPCYQREEPSPTKIQVSSSPTKITIKSQASGEGEEGLVKPEALFVSKADQYFCEVCDGGDDDSLMLLCDGCDNAYHTYCLVPPLDKVPPGDWMCPRCIAKECCRPMEAYGFEQSTVEYSLESFGAMADQFKANHFNMSPHLVPLNVCEKEFWRLVECLEEDVSVEYGADIHSGEQGSGFPTEKTKDQFVGYEEYISSGWNLNNLPVLDLSVLKHVSVDISGMMIPWCYVGMCFSSFSWHIEDHWSYSVNYMHWGEPKTWYGVPGSHAELLEECMMKEVPELFKHSPDLLHQLTTIINPNVLMDYGVPVYRTDQCPGEFIITFPRSYHAGFNQGYNFAEAINFCPPDWVKLGRECIESYRRLKRQCVFSHDQLLCEMAEKSATLDLKMAAVVYDDLLLVVAKETKLREKVAAAGITMSERFLFDSLEDDDRQCDACKTTCYLSTVVCPKDTERHVCLDHDIVSEMKCGCQPSNHILRYKHTLDELYGLVEALRQRSLSLDIWKAKVTEVLEQTSQVKPDVSYLRELISTVVEKNLPRDDQLQRLKEKLQSTESCIELARELMNKKINSKLQKSLDTYLSSHTLTVQQQQQQQLQQPFTIGSRLNLGELRLFIDRVKDLPCTFKEADLIQDLMKSVLVLQKEVVNIMTSDSMPPTQRLQEVADWASSLNVDFPELPRLHQLLVQSKWLAEYHATFGEGGCLAAAGGQGPAGQKLTIDQLRKLCGNLLASSQGGVHPLYQAASGKVKGLLSCSDGVERKAELCLRERPTMQVMETVIEESGSLAIVELPKVALLRGLLARAKQWQELASMQMNRGHGLHLDELDYLIELGTGVPARFEALDSLHNRLKMAVQWKQKVYLAFFHGLRKSILQPWFRDVGISLDSNYPRKKEVVVSKDGTFICPNSAITLASLQLVVKGTVEKLVAARNASTKKMLENGKSTSSTPIGQCSCGRSFAEHNRCCLLCTIVYLADCSALDNNSPANQQHAQLSPAQSQLPSPISNQSSSNASTKRVGLIDANIFGSGSSPSNKIFGSFPMTNQGLFTTPNKNPIFLSTNTLPSPFQTNQSPGFNHFGTASSPSAGLFSTIKNQGPVGGPFALTGQNHQTFILNNNSFLTPSGGTGLFHWGAGPKTPGTSVLSAGSDMHLTSNSNNAAATAAKIPASRLCPACSESTERPTYEELKSLVAGWYLMSGICMPEGRALLYLIDLVNEWQQKARKVLTSRELVVAAGLLELPSLEGKDDQQTSGLPIPESISRLSTDPSLKPRLVALDVPIPLQAGLSDLLVEMLALNIETQECRQIRSLLYACYEKVVLTEAMRKEEEARQQAKLEEERKRKLEEAERQRKAAEEKRKREEEEARKRKIEEEEYKRRVEEENRRRKIAEEEQRRRKEKQLLLQQQQQQQQQQQLLLQQQQQQQQQLLLQQQQQQAEREALEKKRKFSQSMEDDDDRPAAKSRGDDGRKQRREGESPAAKKSHRKARDLSESDSDASSSRSDDNKRDLAEKSNPFKKLASAQSNAHKVNDKIFKATPSKAAAVPPARAPAQVAPGSSVTDRLKTFLTNDDSDDDLGISAAKNNYSTKKGSGKHKSSSHAGGVNNKAEEKKVKKKSAFSTKDIYSDDDDDDDDDYVNNSGTADLKSVKKKHNHNKEVHNRSIQSSSAHKKNHQGGKKIKKKKKRRRDDDDDDGCDSDDDDDLLEGERVRDAASASVAAADGDLNGGNTWDVCSSKTCLKPIGAKVDWVQCDRCELWYHLVCVQLAELPEEDEEYLCPSCTRPNPSNHRSNNNNNSSSSNSNNASKKDKKHSSKATASNSSSGGQRGSKQAKVEASKFEDRPAVRVEPKPEVKNKLNSFSCALSESMSSKPKKKKKVDGGSKHVGAASSGKDGDSVATKTKFSGSASAPVAKTGKKQSSPYKTQRKTHSGRRDSSASDDDDDDDDDDAEDDSSEDEDYSKKKSKAVKAAKHVGKDGGAKHSRQAVSASAATSRKDAPRTSKEVARSGKDKTSPKKKKQKTLSTSSSSSSSSSSSRRQPAYPKSKRRGTDDEEEEDSEDDDTGDDSSSGDSRSFAAQQQQQQHQVKKKSSSSNIDSYLYAPWLDKS